MNTTTRKARSLTAALLTFGSLVGGANAAITVSGNISTGSGLLSITQDITLTFLGPVGIGDRDNWSLVFDEWVTSDGAGNAVFSSSFDYVSDGASPAGNGTYSTEPTVYLVDNLGYDSGDISANDGYLLFSIPAVSGQFTNAGDQMTILTGSWNLSSSSLMNPEIIGEFTGNVFLANSAGNRITDIVSVPEPSSTALLSFGCLSLAFRRSRHKMSNKRMETDR